MSATRHKNIVVSGSVLCWHDRAELAKSADIWLSGHQPSSWAPIETQLVYLCCIFPCNMHIAIESIASTYHIIYLASNHKIKELCSESGKMSLLLEDLKSLFYYFERPVSTKQHISLSSRSRSNLLVDREARYVLIVYCSYVELGSSMEIKLSKACS